jgi:glycosyltransferase involved in cell wall biosynthesis
VLFGKIYVRDKLADKKIKILTLSDHPMSPSGVGTQTKYILTHLLDTGNYSVVSFGGAVKHENYTPQKTKDYGDDWIIFPVDGYGDQNRVRAALRDFKPDMIWFMTDPRFFTWLWDIEDEIRSKVPMIYYHVWDNKPYPKFNKPFYQSTDVICTISKVTDDIVRNVSPETECHYIPHIVNPEVFKKLPKEEVDRFKKNAGLDDKFLVFWNSRNARRKMSGSLVWWFKDFLDEVGHDKARLLMHTDPKDQHGQDLEQIIVELGLTNGEVMFSTKKNPPQELNFFYNAADVTCGISDAEGFGLSTFESLATGTPILVNMTGGLQEQVTDGKKWFGIGIEPSSKAIIGSQAVPFIYEDRISREDFISSLKKLYEMGPEKREKLGELGMKHIEKNYNFQKTLERWDTLLKDVHERHGSWENRKNYKKWEMFTL